MYLACLLAAIKPITTLFKKTLGQQQHLDIISHLPNHKVTTCSEHSFFPQPHVQDVPQATPVVKSARQVHTLVHLMFCPCGEPPSGESYGRSSFSFLVRVPLKQIQVWSVYGLFGFLPRLRCKTRRPSRPVTKSPVAVASHRPWPAPRTDAERRRTGTEKPKDAKERKSKLPGWS